MALNPQPRSQPLTPNQWLDAFVADGNRLIGPRPAKYIGTFEMVWKGGGSVIELDEGVTFSMAKLAFPSGGGTIQIGKGATAKVSYPPKIGQ